MKDFENKFEKLVSRLDVDDKPSAAHRDSTRFKMLAEFNKAKSARDGLHRTWRTAMNNKITKFTIAAIIIAAILIGISTLTGKDETKQEIVKDPAPKKIETLQNNPELIAQQKLIAELKLADTLFAAGNTKGLIKLLDIGEIESKISAANYLADLSAEDALDKLKDLADNWQGEDENPFAIAADRIKAAVAKQQPVDAASNSDNSTSGNEIDNAEVGLISQIVDPDSITDVYILEGALRDDGFRLERETWIKGTKYYRVEDSRSVTIDNGVNILVLDKNAKTAQMQKSGGRQRRGVSFEYVQSIIASVQNEEMPGSVMLVENPDGSTQEKVIQPRLVLLADECSEKELVYAVDPNSLDGQVSYMNFKLWVDVDTLLLDRTLSGSQPGRGEQWQFWYDEIPIEKFSITVPEGYKKLMAPKFAGRIIDAEGNPMEDFNIYVFGRPSGSASGTSDSQGNFQFDIPTVGTGHPSAMGYPLFVRAESDKYPGWAGWTIIQNPNEFNDSLLDWIPEQADIKVATDNSGKCLGVWGVNIVVEPAYEISGIIVDRYDRPIPNATVTAHIVIFEESWLHSWSMPGEGKQGKYTVKTDDQGQYSLTGIPAFAWINFEESMSKEDIEKRKQNRSVRITVRVAAKGYIGKSSNAIGYRDEIKSKKIDFVLSRSDVTVTGRVINNYGKPIPNRLILYGESNSFGSNNVRTDTTGSFKQTGAPADESLKLKIASEKPYDWDRNKATKGKKYKNYLDRIIDVGFEEGRYEYDLGDIVLDEPELTVELEVKDISGNAIEGLEVTFYDHSMNHYWQQEFKAKTDIDGRCVFENYPDIKKSRLSVQWHFTGEAENDEEQQRRDHLKRYCGVFENVELPGDIEGYFIEVTVSRFGEKDFKGDRIRIYGSDGNLTWPIEQK